MIRSFRHKGLKELFEAGASAKVAPALQSRVMRCLDALADAAESRDMAIPGLQFHPLRGKAQRYSVHVNGPWCVTFEFRDSDAWHVDLERYH